MWRIGQLARMAGVSDHTLRHYDKIGLLRPAAVDHASGYRWYGVAELTRLERIRGLARLGLSLRQIADIVDAPDAHLRQALTETVAAIRRDIAAMTATVAAAEDHLAAAGTPVLPQQTTVEGRRLRVQYRHVEHPVELAGLCGDGPSTLLTWLSAEPSGGFAVAMAADRAGESLTLPARTVVRAVVPTGNGVAITGQDLFGWLRRHHLTVAGPTVEEHLVDTDGAHATVLEIPIQPGARSAATGPGDTALPDPLGRNVRGRMTGASGCNELL